ncbi:MAG: carbohydrate binding family 9 domain-containing protein [Acidobacteria bacterium]|nr:carbohydrate binding family 9 domain-containing protein [Acidobacteriota bacterium]
MLRGPDTASQLEAVALTSGAEVIQLDGAPDEEIWSRAPSVNDFRQRDPAEGAAATFPTDARAAFDDRALYVAVRASDPEPQKIVGMLTRRDAESPSDWIRVIVDSYRDRRTAYEFAVNAAGVKQDKYWFNDESQDVGWDAVWDAVVRRNAQGWTAEFRIPLSQLRFNQQGAATFGFAVVRQVARLKETVTWPLLAKSANGYVSNFGALTGLMLGSSAKRLELMPYAVSSVSTQPALAGNPFVSAANPDAAFGADLKYALTPGLTLTATINPDFGQVEADPAVVNLSAFETFFSERRPFFVEGSGIFKFDVDCNDGQCTGLFYSRRIGRAPRGTAEIPEGGFSSAPAQSTILGAAKLTGRAGSFSIGALSAVTAEEQAQVAFGATRTRQTVEPLSGYTVIRAKREFANRSSIGFITTATNRRLTDRVSFLPNQAHTGGVDWDWRLKQSTYSMSGNWAGSSVRGSTGAIGRLQRSNVHLYQRPDANHIDLDPTRTALNGHAGFVSLSKVGGERVRFSFNTGYKSPGFDINDLGFLSRADQQTFSGWVQLRFDKPGKHVRNVRLNFNTWRGWNFDGDLLYGGHNINAHWVFQNNWSAGFGGNLNQGGFSDRATRGGPGAQENGEWSFWQYLNTDDRRLVSAGYGTFYLNDNRGRWLWDAGPGVTIRPTTALSINQSIGFTRNVDPSQWIDKVTDVRDHYVFGHLDQITVRLTTRVNYTITPDLSIQVYAQPFVSAGEYTRFKELTDGRADRYEDRFAAFGYAGRPDFNYQSFRTTNVLRWEYRPGSTLFVVWQQGREEVADRGDFRFGRDLSHAFTAPAYNVVLVKLSYWLNY